jgi:DNA-binding XRE family transcriptional regulator
MTAISIRHSLDHGPSSRGGACDPVGEQTCDAREEAELSQGDLAQPIGTSQAAVARLEAGGVGATLTTLRRAASAAPRHCRRARVSRADPKEGCDRVTFIDSIARPSLERRDLGSFVSTKVSFRFAFVDVRSCTFERVCKKGGRGFESHRLNRVVSRDIGDRCLATSATS